MSQTRDGDLDPVFETRDTRMMAKTLAHGSLPGDECQ